LIKEPAEQAMRAISREIHTPESRMSEGNMMKEWAMAGPYTVCSVFCAYLRPFEKVRHRSPRGNDGIDRATIMVFSIAGASTRFAIIIPTFGGSVISSKHFTFSVITQNRIAKV
jgi:hypothetical protein